jgi:hypothetical protein
MIISVVYRQWGRAAARAAGNRIWRGAASNTTAAVWAAELGTNLQSSTLESPFHIQQAAQLRAYQTAWNKACVTDSTNQSEVELCG